MEAAFADRLRLIQTADVAQDDADPGVFGREGAEDLYEDRRVGRPGNADGELTDLALVHARLAAVADGCYPAVARRYQQRGTVQLSFCTDASGGAASSSITVSSGAEVLDAAARGCVVQRASPFPAVAASRCFSVPVRFGAR